MALAQRSKEDIAALQGVVSQFSDLLLAWKAVGIEKSTAAAAEAAEAVVDSDAAEEEKPALTGL